MPFPGCVNKNKKKKSLLQAKKEFRSTVDLTHIYVQVLMHPKRKLDSFCGRVGVLFFFYWLNTRLVGSVFGCWLIVFSPIYTSMHILDVVNLDRGF